MTDSYRMLADNIPIVPDENPGNFSVDFTVPENFAPLNGHFPGNPILPGIAQISIVSAIMEKALAHPLELVEVRRVKFLSPATPGMALNIRIKYADNTVSADFFSGETKISSLKLVYAGA